MRARPTSIIYTIRYATIELRLSLRADPLQQEAGIPVVRILGIILICGLTCATGCFFGQTCNPATGCTETSVSATGSIPQVLLVTSPATDGRYGLAHVIPIQLVFDYPVVVSGIPLLRLETGSQDAFAPYASGSGSNILTFLYTVALDHTTLQLDYLATDALVLGGSSLTGLEGATANELLPPPGSSQSLAGSRRFHIDGRAAIVNSVTSPFSSGVYKLGQEIDIHLKFDRAVLVTGTPQLELPTTNVNLTSGSGTDTLVFKYHVQPTHEASLLDVVSASSLLLNEGTIKDVNEVDASTILPAPGEPGSLSANVVIQVAGTALLKYFQLEGALDNAHYGNVVASLGDWNGDGRSDFAVRGSNLMESAYLDIFNDAGSLIVQTENLAGLGLSVAGISDSDGDGRKDIIVGRPALGGKVTKFLSGSGGAAGPTSSGSSDDCGTAVAGIGDIFDAAGSLGQDGVADLLIGCPGYDNGSGDGAIRVANGANFQTTQLFYPVPGGTSYGSVIATRPETVPGAFAAAEPQSEGGRVYLVLGLNTGTLGGDYIVNPFPTKGTSFGTTLALMTVNGSPAVLVGAPEMDNSGDGNERGMAFLFSADGEIIHTFYAEGAANQHLGKAAAVADVNGDSIDDILLGGDGVVHIYSGVAPFTRVYLDNFHAAATLFGNTITVLPSSQGKADFVVGAPDDNGSGTARGTVQLFHGFTF